MGEYTHGLCAEGGELCKCVLDHTSNVQMYMYSRCQ